MGQSAGWWTALPGGGLAAFRATVSTAGASYVYDPDISRITRMTDATGISTYSYVPMGQPGAMQMEKIDGPLSGQTDLISYTYDDLGRLTTRNIGPGGNENKVTLEFDSLGRTTSVLNNLGTFGYGYVGATGRLNHINLPNGQKTEFSYYG